jgi:hypothetical protein
MVGRGPGHHDRDGNAEPRAVIGDGLGMIAGGSRDHAARPRRLVHLQQFVEGAALLVGGGELQILELHVDFGAGQLRKGAAEQSGGADDRAPDPIRRRADIFERDGEFVGGEWTGHLILNSGRLIPSPRRGEGRVRGSERSASVDFRL